LLAIQLRYKSKVRLRKKIGAAVQDHFAVFEHPRVQTERRGVLILAGPHVADVCGLQIDASKVQRTKFSSVDIGQLAIGDHEFIYLERVNFLDSLLPTSILQRGFVLSLFLKLIQVNDKFGILYAKIRNKAPKEKSFPINTGAQQGDMGDRGFRVSVLSDDRVFQIQRKADGMEIKASYLYVVSFKGVV
jgi:hypothetical protein